MARTRKDSDQANEANNQEEIIKLLNKPNFKITGPALIGNKIESIGVSGNAADINRLFGDKATQDKFNNMLKNIETQSEQPKFIGVTKDGGKIYSGNQMTSKSVDIKSEESSSLNTTPKHR